jgi:hypothetical protein
MNTLSSIIGLFSIGALIGMYLLALVLKSKETPKFVALLHGAFVVAALIMLCVYALNHSPSPTESVVLFVVAALGGMVLIVRDLSGKPLPKWLAFTHGLIALGGFVYLLVYACTL